jgi:hypothetical protein
MGFSSTIQSEKKFKGTSFGGPLMVAGQNTYFFFFAAFFAFFLVAIFLFSLSVFWTVSSGDPLHMVENISH